MGPAPIPPHERQWRHPSELAPTAADVDTPTNSRALVLATGTTALLLAAVLVIALSPPRSSAPSAVSATTLPAATIELQNPSDEASRFGATSEEATRPERKTFLSEQGLVMVGAPNAVSAAPVGDPEDFAIAGNLPDRSDRVVVLMASHAYDLRWGDIDDIAAPNGAIVMTRDGSLLAMFVSNELRLLVD